MSGYTLELTPYKKDTFTIPLYASDEQADEEAKNKVKQADTEHPIVSKWTYELELISPENLKIKKVLLFINDILEDCEYNGGKIEAKKKWLFGDCYGYVTIGLTLTLVDGTERHLVSQYLPVTVMHEHQTLDESVGEMLRYVYDNYEDFLKHGTQGAKDNSGVKKDSEEKISDKLKLAEEIANLYESNYGYFHRFKLDKVPTVDSFEKLQDISSATIQFITSHPEYLKRVNSTTGVRCGNQVYHPEKTLVMKQRCSYDIYENKVLVGFLRHILAWISKAETENQCKEILEKASLCTKFTEMQNHVEILHRCTQLDQLKGKFVRLLHMYQGVFSIHAQPINTMPEATPIFMSVPQYHAVFSYIYHWFHSGAYDYDKDDFILSFTNASSLYEVYLLTKMIAYLTSHGYELPKSMNKKPPFRYNDKNRTKYKDTPFQNTFVFQNQTNKDITLTLYFQPVIYPHERKARNGINLYRNNSIPVHFTDDTGSNYYSPDYLLKYKHGNRTTYVIADAKFMDYKNVRRYQIKELVFKYLFSISPCNSQDTIAGLCVLYGKHFPNEESKDVYNKKIPKTKISPFFDCIPMMAKVDDSLHDAKFKQLFDYLSSL